MGGSLARISAIVAALACVVAVLALTGEARPAASGSPSFDAVTISGKPAAHGEIASKPAVAWCGTDETSADRTPEVNLSAAEQIHVVYAVPSDGVDQFGAYTSRIASDAGAIDAWWRGQDPSRAPRFDLFAFPGCGSQFGMLDISFIRLPQSSSYYGADLPTRMGRLTTDFRGRFGPRMKTLVYYDGPVPESNVCGTAWTLPPDGPNDAFGFAFVWLQATACPNDVGSAAVSATALIHETVHNLGAFTSPGAPHECPTSPHHACDSTLDLMYPAVTPSTTLAAEILDFGRDDYYGHSNPALVDVQDSLWLSHLPQLPLSVGVTARAGASGSVLTSLLSNPACTSSCTYTLDNGTKVNLKASPGKGSRLVAWGGACTGAGACTVTMDAAKTVTAQFALATFTISVSVSGKGHVTSTPIGISCPRRCSHRFLAGAKVQLQAKPTKGFRFTGWSGSCHGKSACTLSTSRNRSAHATFKRK
jgi:hypothetical protein